MMLQLVHLLRRSRLDSSFLWPDNFRFWANTVRTVRYIVCGVWFVSCPGGQ